MSDIGHTPESLTPTQPIESPNKNFWALITHRISSLVRREKVHPEKQIPELAQDLYHILKTKIPDADKMLKGKFIVEPPDHNMEVVILAGLRGTTEVVLIHKVPEGVNRFHLSGDSVSYFQQRTFPKIDKKPIHLRVKDPRQIYPDLRRQVELAPKLEIKPMTTPSYKQ